MSKIRYEIRKGASKPCELVSLARARNGGEVVRFICEGTFTECSRVRTAITAVEI